MHQSAMFYAEKFFEVYCPGALPLEFTIAEIGSQNVNGSLREVAPTNVRYIGLDFAEGKDVDVVMSDPYHLPLEDGMADVVVTSSCFEHSEFFWLLFLEAMRVLKNDGIFYINAPSNGFFHRWPVDCWRFYPDSGHALVSWAAHHGGKVKLLESFIGQRSAGCISEGGMWNDFVAVFVKNEKFANKYPDRIVHSITNFYNGYSSERSGVLNFNERGPDFSLIDEYSEQIISLNQAITERDEQIASLNQAVAERDGQIASFAGETVRRGEWVLGLDAEPKAEHVKVVAHTTSRSWRIARPLREARRWASSPEAQTTRYTKSALQLAKRLYQSLPLGYQTKARHRQWIAKAFPRILLASGAHPSTIPELSIPQPAISHVSNWKNFKVIESLTVLATDIMVPTAVSPLVSVIIPIYGKIDYTLRCLASIAANPPQVAFEVIVVDDCSPDDSWGVLSKVKGIHLLRNELNQGFIRTCNIGAKAAKGQYLHFLNNDTEVIPDWMDELLRTFTEFPGTGLAGSKLIYPDGRLQEAGGIIWQDGSAWNFGRFQDPQLPVYNYAREVDYCSGASIMVPKPLFEELGGFDERYMPAYCEDSDLALKIRAKGYRVIYQPLSMVFHFEGVTSGTDTAKGTKAYQVENSKKLYERWRQHLEAHQASGTDIDNAKDRRATRRVLVLDHCTPTPNQDAGSVTVFNLLLLLREIDFQVTFIPEDNFRYMREYTTSLQRNGIEVLYAPYFTSVDQHLKEQGARYDLVFLFRPGVVERHLRAIRKHCPKAKVLYHTVDLHFLRMAREAELQKDKAKERAAQGMRQHELATIQAADASIVHSTAELKLLRLMLPDAKVHVFPLIMDVKGTTKGFAERRDIVFVGGYQHTPNVDAVQYFVKDVMPLLRKQLPGVRFYAVGSKPPIEIQALASEDVLITGFVEDLNSLLDTMRVSVAPLRYGAGIKGKVGTAMAVGLPVVATSLAAEGMSLTDGENVLLADGSEAYAETIAKVYNDKELWNHISQNGLVFADKAWGAEAAWSILATILADFDFKVSRGPNALSLYSPPVAASSNSQLLPIGSVRPRPGICQQGAGPLGR